MVVGSTSGDGGSRTQGGVDSLRVTHSLAPAKCRLSFDLHAPCQLLITLLRQNQGNSISFILIQHIFTLSDREGDGGGNKGLGMTNSKERPSLKLVPSVMVLDF